MARTTLESARARTDSLRKQSEAAQAAVALARANAEQTAMRRATVDAGVHQLAAAEAQRDKAQVQFLETEIRAPMAGIVDVRAARPGEVVAAGQAVLTLIDPDNLWVRVDVEESYIDRIHPGDKVAVRLPSGAEREGTVFYRRVDADYATQRDVSRTKRDIRTFEVRVRCDNRDRSLAVGHDGVCHASAAQILTGAMFDIEVENLTKCFGDFLRRGCPELHGGSWRGFRPARAERGGEIHPDPHADHAGAADLGPGARQRLRRRAFGQRRAAIDRRHPAGNDFRSRS